MKKTILSIALVNLLAGCASDQPKEAIQEPAAPATSAAAKPAGTSLAAAKAAAAKPAATQPSTSGATTAAAPVTTSESTAETVAASGAESNSEAAAEAMDKQSAYFPFDVDALQDDDHGMVQAQGAYLSKHREAKVRVEGHADERGSSEYNLALGQRRANNVGRALLMSGAGSAQIDTVSFGEEKPRASSHDEESWAQNRRADILYTAK